MALLEIKNLTQQFGGLTALSDVNISIEEGEIVGLIGPNGAGKTTLFNLITGVYEPTEGEIILNTEGNPFKINGQKPFKIADAGIARTFQNIRLFSQLSVLDNVLIAMHSKRSSGLPSALFRLPSFYKNERDMREKAIQLLTIFELENLVDEKASSLAYGQQRRLEIVRAMATEPKIIFLDEPAAGMNHSETASLTEAINRINKEFGITIVLIEHDMDLVMDLSERLYVLEYGRLIASGSPEEIQKDERVIQAYLGGE